MWPFSKRPKFRIKKETFGDGTVVYLLQELTWLGSFGVYYEAYETLHSGSTEKKCKELLDEILKARHRSSIVKSEIVYQKN